MTTFTESHLRRMIENNEGREIGLYLCNGAIVSGVVAGLDKNQDGFIEVALDTDDGRVQFVAPVENIVAYEMVESEENEE